MRLVRSGLTKSTRAEYNTTDQDKMASEILREGVRKQTKRLLREADIDLYNQLESDCEAMQQVEKAIGKSYKLAINMLDRSTSVEEALQCLEPAHADRVKKTFRFQSCKAFFQDIDRTTHLKLTTLDGDTLKCCPEAIPLVSKEYLNEANRLLCSRIIVESVLMILDMAGISFPVKPKAMDAAISLIAVESKPELRKMVEKMARDYWRKDTSAVADEIFRVLKSLNGKGLLIRVIKKLFEDLPWYNKAPTIVKALAMVVTFTATEMTKSVTRIIIFLVTGSQFLKKLEDVQKLGDIRKETLKEKEDIKKETLKDKERETQQSLRY